VIEGIKLNTMQEALENGNLDPKEIVKAKAGQQQDYGKTDGIPECGSDALRFGLLAYTSQGRDVNLDVSRVVGYRHLCNKVWQANKLFHNHVGDWKPPASPPDVSKASFAVQYLLHRTHLACTETHDLLGKFDFSAATTTIYNFWWYVLCDTFIELSKPALNSADKELTLYAYYAALHFGLRMSHPFLPFMTEELFQHLPRHSDDREALCIERYPSTGHAAWQKDQLDEDWKSVDAAVHSVRSLYSSYGIIKKPVPPVYLKALDKDTQKLFNVYAEPIKTLLVSEGVVVLSPTDQPPKGSAAEVVNSKVTAYVVVAGMIDLDKEVAKQEKKVADVKQRLASLNNRLGQPQYAEKSPEHVQKADKQKLEDLKKEKATAEAAQKSMENLKNGVEDEPAAAAADKDDDDFDLFGSDDEDDSELEERVKAAQARIDAKASAKGKVTIAKSALTMDVKPWEADTDMKKLEACVRSVQMDGLLWGKSKLVDVAFGVKKLQINAVVEDEKVSTDDMQEQIEAFEDYVQSVDVVAFQKI
jgi:valyl-tRNA synthetase